MNDRDKNNIVRLAVDSHRGEVHEFSKARTNEVLREALIDACGGSTTIDIRAARDGKYTAAFSIMEEILKQTVWEGLQGNEFFVNLVERRNAAPGEAIEFNIEDRDLFMVSEVADGTYGLRRQRLGGYRQLILKPTLKAVKIYEDISRIMAGLVSFDDMISRVGRSFTNRYLNDAYTLFANATADDFGGTNFVPTAGTCDEDKVLDVISDVETKADGKVATVFGTRKALRNLKLDNPSESAKTSLETLGYYGNFYGSNCVVVPQRFKPGTTERIFADNELYVIAGDPRPIKDVHEGDPIVFMGDPMQTKDFTQEYFYAEKYALGLIMSGSEGGIGKYVIA